MDLKEIADNYSKNKRSMITNSVVSNSNYQKNFTRYHAESLNTMFAEWHLLFPTQKQDIHCSSCRKAVVKFWEMIVDEWIVSAQTPIKKTNASKNKKTKAK